MPLSLDPIYILFIAIVVFLVSYLLVSYFRESSTQKKEERGRIITIKKCLNCGYVLSKPYEKGDYVGKKEGRCPKCNGEMMTTAIYLEPPPQPQVATSS
ncbi:MAG: hypothetical protein ACP5KB_00350 [Thermoprotei archaeon]